jgi:hypothetical protein
MNDIPEDGPSSPSYRFSSDMAAPDSLYDKYQQKDENGKATVRTTNQDKLGSSFKDKNNSSIASSHAQSNTRRVQKRAYTLPYAGDHRNRFVSTADIIREFSKLDIHGEGKLNYLLLKSSLALLSGNEDEYDDTLIRGWLREYDVGHKGYVDLDDFQNIYERWNDTSSAAKTATQTAQAISSGINKSSISDKAQSLRK